jgi:glutamyl-tRNA reductase
MTPGRDSVERIRRHEVSRVLRMVDLSPEEEEAVELMSRSLVGRLLHGPISRVMARAEVEFSSADRRVSVASRAPEASSPLGTSSLGA